VEECKDIVGMGRYRDYVVGIWERKFREDCGFFCVDDCVADYDADAAAADNASVNVDNDSNNTQNLIKQYNNILNLSYTVFVNTLMQLVDRRIRDISELLRLIQLVYPKYIGILSRKLRVNNNTNRTNNNSNNSNNSNNTNHFYLPDVNSVMISRLCTREFMDLFKNVLECVYDVNHTVDGEVVDGDTVSGGGSGSGSGSSNDNAIRQQQESNADNSRINDAGLEHIKLFPEEYKVVIISSYICSHNSPNTDKTLFTNESNGRRKKKRKGTHKEDDDGNGKKEGGNWYPLERLLSVIASLSPSLNYAKIIEIIDMLALSRIVI
jgi:hypothetical protein